jgi:hypothetical protein
VWDAGYETESLEDDTDSENSDGEAEEETDDDWTWYHTETEAGREANVYFKQTSIQGIEEGKQVFIRYGQRSSRHLMLWYGFCFLDNKYDVVILRHEYNTFRLRREKICRTLIGYHRRKLVKTAFVDIPLEPAVELEAVQTSIDLL